MLGAMRTLALDYLFQELDEAHPPDDLDTWYQDLRANSPEKLFRFLVEDTGKIEKIFFIRKSEDSNLAEVHVMERRPEISQDLPFVKPSGSQGAQIGPVIKRTYTKKNGAGPSRKILNTTIGYFRELATSDKSWSSYFEEIVAILDLARIKVDGTIIDWKDSGYESLLECVVQEIGEVRGTALVTLQDKMGNFPGKRPEYLEYLSKHILAGDRYLTQKAPANTAGNCSLCGITHATVFPNALKGAGINLINMDRKGRFPSLEVLQAWKGYALCAPCADLLYVYKNHVLKKTGPKKDRTPFTARIAGESALVIPFSTMKASARQDLLRDVRRFIRNIPDDVEADEENLLDILKDEKGLLNLTFLWVDIGQNLENVTGVLTDVPPSRLRELSQINEKSKKWKHPLFPEIPIVTGEFDLRADLSLKALYSLFHRPGGKKAQDSNKSKRLFQLKRTIAASVYHKIDIPCQRFWDELITTARWYWLQAMEGTGAYTLLYEGDGKKGPFLTTAGWIRHMAWWIYYFGRLEVLEMNDYSFEPEMATLKPYFGPESGISSREKAYAFLLGALYGRVLEIQGAKGVNVGANALTWLKRLTLNGKDLPELYVKIREKLLAYEAEKSEKVRNLINEIGKLGVKLGDPIELSQTQTNYYLLLGQSMTRTILK
ncbi:MAG: CRISPR-associated protein, partial [Proteobacteria bacterium]|nr:CRISPR-associated protein [Pseudomonadota bacterium]